MEINKIFAVAYNKKESKTLLCRIRIINSFLFLAFKSVSLTEEKYLNGNFELLTYDNGFSNNFESYKEYDFVPEYKSIILDLVKLQAKIKDKKLSYEDKSNIYNWINDIEKIYFNCKIKENPVEPKKVSLLDLEYNLESLAKISNIDANILNSELFERLKTILNVHQLYKDIINKFYLLLNDLLDKYPNIENTLDQLVKKYLDISILSEKDN